MEALEEIKKGNKILRIYQDETGEDPRQWDNLSNFILKHPHYNLPYEIDFNFSDYENEEEAIKSLKELGAVIIKRVKSYEHSSFYISLNDSYPFNDKWDSSFIGYVIMLKSDIIKEYGKFNQSNLKKAEQVLLSEFKTYKDYLEGNVYGFNLVQNIKVKITKEYLKGKKEVINTTEEKIMDSCWGFYGDEGIKQIKEENKF